HLSPSGEKLARKLGVPESEWAAIQNTGKAKHPTLSDIRAYNKSRGRPVEFDEDRAGAVEALKTLVSKRGVRAAREMLAHFSVVKVSDLKDDQLAEWVAKVEE
ncbi:MAG: hypothetical protein GWN58_32525, partial [Anaerolineae bacterium]|nr:hypothetical protein [Anaerolineae bacterium]